MKGYLQRMAAHAARPQGGIHPIVGSIYASTAFADTAFAERGTAAESAAVTEEHLLAGSTKTVSAGKGVHEGRSDARRVDIERPDEQSEERSSGTRHDESSPFRPLLSNARNRPAAGKNETARFENDDHASRTLESRYESLLPREARSPIVTAAVQAAKPVPVSRTAPAEREPDKIEIHIGRIEVTAVPQEAPRSAVPRARKSLNLGEYLKRDGRTG